MSHRPASYHPWRNGDRATERPTEVAEETVRCCRVCKVERPIEQFSSVITRNGRWYRRRCRKCDSVYFSERWRNRDERLIASRQAYQAKERTTGLRRKRANEYHRRRVLAAGREVPEPAPERWYSVVRASIELLYSEWTVRKLCREGKIIARKTWGKGGIQWRIDPASVRRFKYTGEA